MVTGVGGKRSLGEAIALALARESANVVVTDIIIEGAQAVAQEITEMGRRFLASELDQGVYEEIKDAVIKYKNNWGRIVNIASGAGVTGQRGMLADSASKGALITLTEVTVIFVR